MLLIVWWTGTVSPWVRARARAPLYRWVDVVASRLRWVLASVNRERFIEIGRG